MLVVANLSKLVTDRMARLNAFYGVLVKASFWDYLALLVIAVLLYIALR